MTWHILAVHPPTFDRWCEFEVRDALTDHDGLDLHALVPVELALRHVRGKAGRTIKRRPILQGYVFAEFEPERYPDIRCLPGVRGVLQLGEGWATLTARQVNALEALSRTPEILREIAQFKLGDRVRIRRGAMTEIHGIVSLIEQCKVAEVDVEMMGKVHRVKVREKDVEAA